MNIKERGTKSNMEILNLKQYSTDRTESIVDQIFEFNQDKIAYIQTDIGCPECQNTGSKRRIFFHDHNMMINYLILTGQKRVVRRVFDESW
jgi:hypothetical protein